MPLESITIEPPLQQWPALLKMQPSGELFACSLSNWRHRTRGELGLDLGRAILATGHQPTLWHPGILAKYIAVDAVRRATNDSIATLNVIVDQDVVDQGSFDVPMRRSDGLLAARRIELSTSSMRKAVPVGQRPAFVPRDVEIEALAELPDLNMASGRIHAALNAHATASNSAAQMAGALSQLMSECVELPPMPTILASQLMHTTLVTHFIDAMRMHPHRCADSYNRAIASVPSARLTPLAIHDDFVELPLWRVREGVAGGGERVRAYDADLESTAFSAGGLLPRALFMTAIIRLGVSDVFVHGRGGAQYDLAMERWINDWLGVEVSPMAVASATLTLPLMRDEELMLVRGGAKGGGLSLARRRERLLRHDPESIDGERSRHPGPIKQALVHDIARMPRRSHERRSAFFAMHQRLAQLRSDRSAATEHARVEILRMERLANDAQVAERRDWSFVLYPEPLLRELAKRIRLEIALPRSDATRAGAE